MMAARLIVSATAPFVLALGMERLGISLSLALTATLGAGAIALFGAVAYVGRRAQLDTEESGRAVAG